MALRLPCRSLAAGALAALLLPATAASFPDPGSGWLELRSEHFRLLSDAGEDRSAEIARGLETMRALMAPWAEVLGREAPVPDRVVVLPGEEQFRHYGPRSTGATSTAVAFYARDPWGRLIALNASPRYGRDPTLPAFYSEYSQLFADAILAGEPAWLAAGVVEYYGTFRLLAGKAVVGAALPDRARWLAHHSLPPWGDLLTAKEVTGEEAQAQAWLLVHYLLSQEAEQPGRFAELLRHLAAGAGGDEALEAVYGRPATGLGLEAYARRRSFPYRTLPVAELIGAAPEVAATAASRAAVLTELGTLLLLRGGEALGEAEEHFEAALALDPDDPGAHTGLARLALARGDRQAAEGHLEAAVAHESPSAAPYVLYADLLLRDFLATGGDAGSDAGVAVARRARALLPRAAGLKPDLPQRRALLAATEPYEEEAVPAATADADVRRGNARYDQALELFDHGQTADALTELKALLAETEDPELRQAADELRREIEAAPP
jgi:tetratricopeptide (TPR) repeat protein